MGDDKKFREIIAREFNETVTPDKPMPEPQPTGPEPADDFHLDLYLGEEDYRSVNRGTWALGKYSVWGIVVMALGLIVLIARVAAGLSSWIGWIGFFLVLAGIILLIVQIVTHRPSTDDDDGAIV